MTSTDNLTDLRRRIADLKEHQEATKHERRAADHHEVADGFAAVFGLMDELAAAIEDLQQPSRR